MDDMKRQKVDIGTSLKKLQRDLIMLNKSMSRLEHRRRADVAREQELGRQLSADQVSISVIVMIPPLGPSTLWMRNSYFLI